jgi:hypothetical protein
MEYSIQLLFTMGNSSSHSRIYDIFSIGDTTCMKNLHSSFGCECWVFCYESKGNGKTALTRVVMCSFLYELDAHLDRLLRSAAKSKIQSPFDRATLRHILLQTVAASGCRRGSLRYWLSAGLGGFGLSSKECYKSTFYAIVSNVTYKGPEGVKVALLCPATDHFQFKYQKLLFCFSSRAWLS